MSKTAKKQKKIARKRRTRRTFKRSSVLPKRSMLMRGGNAVFPATISASDIQNSPQSYLPYNNFANDPGYNVIGARNTGPFLTGTTTGGNIRRRKICGGSSVSTSMTNDMNAVTSMSGLQPLSLNINSGGLSGMMSHTMNQFSGNSGSFGLNSAPIAPLA